MKQGAGRRKVVGIGAQLLQQAAELWLRLQQLQQVGGLHPLQLHLPVHVDLLVEGDVHQAGAVAAPFAGVEACTESPDVLIHLEADDSAVVIDDVRLSVPGTRNHLLVAIALV